MGAHYDEEMDEPDALVVDAVQAFAARLREREASVAPALEALQRLVGCCAQKSGQSYKLRSLLWSLYNGKPASLLDVVALDTDLRRDLGAVLLAWGYEGARARFSYREMREAFESAKLWLWFEAESEEGAS